MRGATLHQEETCSNERVDIHRSTHVKQGVESVQGGL